MSFKKLLQQGDHYISDVAIANYNKKGMNISFSYDAKKDSNIILPLVNYPGYVAVDQTGNRVSLYGNENHMLTVFLKKGYGNISVWYEGLQLFKVADYISLTCFLGFIIWGLIIKRKTEESFDCNKK